MSDLAELACAVGPIIDAHVHLYDPALNRHPWLTDVPAIAKRHMLKEYREAIGPVELAAYVFIEAGAHDDDSLKEARLIAGLSGETPHLGAIVPQVRLERGRAVAPELEAMLRLGPVPAVRRIIAAPSLADADFCIRPDFIAGVKMLPEYDLAFEICVSAVNLPNVVKMVEVCPNVRFVLDHLGKPLIEAGVWEPWRTYFRRLAAFDNVHCKLSGLLVEAGPNYSEEQIRPYIVEAMEAFGTNRLMFGSDFPVQNLVGSYSDWFKIAAQAVRDVAPQNLRSIFHDNAAAFYRIATI